MNRLSAISLFAAVSLAFVASACSDSLVNTPTDSPSNSGAPFHAKLRSIPHGAQVIEDSYIVVLRDDVAGEPDGLARSVAGFGQRFPDMTIGSTFQSGVKGFSARIPEARLRALLEDPRIDFIEPDQVASVCSTATMQTLDWGTNYIGGDSSSTISGNRTGTVSGVEVFIVDTGIDPTHSDLNVVGGINYGNTARDSTAWFDEHGHGTHVAGIVGARDNSAWTVGVAPGIRLFSVRVFGSSGTGATSTIIRGLDWIQRQRALRPTTPMVVNMSLVCSASLALDRNVEALIDSGITVVVAAGNSSTLASNYSPARVADAITVAACSSTGTLATFSNYGSVVDLIAPGVSILSTRWQGGVVRKSGTSMATPHVAGAAALYLSRTGNGSKTPAEVAAALAASAPSWGRSLPTGTPNRMLRVRSF